MFPITDFQILLQAIKERNVPVLDIAQSLANVVTYVVGQLRGKPVVMMSACGTATPEGLESMLSAAIECHADGTAAAKFDWQKLLAALLQILPLFM